MSVASSVAFLAWTKRAGRATDIAAAVDGQVWCNYPRVPRGRRWVPLRYGLSAIATVVFLARNQPSAVIVTNPPVFPALIAAGWSAFTGRPFLLDSHPTAFGAKAHRVSQRLMPVHRMLARRAVAVLVTTEHWVKEVERWGGRGLVVHEPPPHWADIGEQVDPMSRERARFCVLFVGTFASDEPVEQVVEAARLTPELEVLVTGSLDRAPNALVMAAPANVTFTGYLEGAAFANVLRGADAVLTLTTDPTSVMRSAYEAVYVERPLVITDTPVLRELFAGAFFVDNDAVSIAAGLHRVASKTEEEGRSARREAKGRQVLRWQRQHEALVAVLGRRAHR